MITIFYCSECGQKLIKRQADQIISYDQKNGEKIIKKHIYYMCPKRKIEYSEDGWCPSHDARDEYSEDISQTQQDKYFVAVRSANEMYFMTGGFIVFCIAVCVILNLIW